MFSESAGSATVMVIVASWRWRSVLGVGVTRTAVRSRAVPCIGETLTHESSLRVMVQSKEPVT